MRPDEHTAGALHFKPFSEAGFITDLATCRAVIAGGGFTLMGEAVFLGKPMLAIPLDSQFEQLLNARYLEREGFGMWAESAGDPGVLPRFLERVPACARALAGYHQKDNGEILAAVDAWLAKPR
jgi:uncharacterized protein (TIGR00661 family)